MKKFKCDCGCFGEIDISGIHFCAYCGNPMGGLEIAVSSPHPEHAEGSSLGEWISVEDRLPEYHKGVLVCGGSCGDIQMVAILQNTTRSIAENSPKDDRWFAVPGWGHELKPTMWMPLPAPPMTGEGEGR